MKIFITADGACESNPGKMAIGAVITKSTGEEGKREKILELSEKVGSGTNNQAEYLAVLKALQAVKKKFEEENLDSLKGIHVFTDSQLVVYQLQGKYAINNPELEVLADKVTEVANFFRNRSVPVKFKWQESLKTRAAHRLAMKALLGEEKFKEYVVKEDLKMRIDQGDILIPLDIFRLKKYEKLTVSECIVLYLIDTCGKSLFQVADLLGRSKYTIRTQYTRAKKKLPFACNTTAMPPNYQMKDYICCSSESSKWEKVHGMTKRTIINCIEYAHEKLLKELKYCQNRFENVTDYYFECYSDPRIEELNVDVLKKWLKEQAEKIRMDSTQEQRGS